MSQSYDSGKHSFAYIDGANLHRGSASLGWTLDYRRLWIWLQEKYHVERAYIFLGYVSQFRDLYLYLERAGFTLVFKEITYDDVGRRKGNCDADLVLKVS